MLQLPMSSRPNARHSKTDALLVKAKSIGDGGKASGITYLRRGKGGGNPSQEQWQIKKRKIRIYERI